MSGGSRNARMVASFGAWLAEEGRSDLTIRAYTFELEHLTAWAGARSLARLGTEDLYSYLESRAQASDTPATHNVRVAAIRKFCAWLVREGLSRGNAAVELHGQHATRPPVQYLPREAVRRVLEVLHGHLRDTAMFLLVLSTGVRLMELVRLDREDFEADGEGAEVEVHAPAGRLRRVYPSHQATDAVVDYLETRRDEAVPLFISRAGARLAPRTVQGGFAGHFREAGVSGSMQTLRHTFGVHRAQSGVDSHDLQELMGYRTFESTRVYRASDPSRLREVAQRTEERY